MLDSCITVGPSTETVSSNHGSRFQRKAETDSTTAAPSDQQIRDQLPHNLLESQ